MPESQTALENDASALRIAYLINSLGPGGAERSLAEMMPLLIEAGLTPRIFTLFHQPQNLAPLVSEAGAAVEPMPHRGWAGRVLFLRRRLSETQPSLLHTTLFESDLVGRIAAVGTGTPVLTSIVNTSYEPERLQDPNIKRWKLTCVRLLDSWTGRLVNDHFHAISQAVKVAAVQRLGFDADRVTVIHRGRDCRRLGEPSLSRKARMRAELGLHDSDEVVVNVARQEFQKGQIQLLRAVSQLLPSRPRLKLIIAGRHGTASPQLQAFLREVDLGQRVLLTGHSEKIPDLLAAADLLAFPSLFEGLGGALIEAMALGLPIVASDLPAIREVVEEGTNALLVPAGVAAPLAAAICELLDDEGKRREFGHAGRELFDKRFRIERAAEEMIRLYEKISSDGRAARPRRKP